MYRDLTHGSITKGLLLFALPMIAGNLLQQLYNIADTLIVGQALGRNALAAVGSAYTLMVFLTSIFLGLSMGAGALFSICLGRGDKKALRAAVAHAFALIGAVTLVLNLSVYLLADPILRFLQIPHELYSSMRDYLLIIFGGLAATFLYNFFACLLRAVGNSVVPLWFLGISALLNIGLDLLFVPVLHFGVAGAAAATVIAQYVSGGGLTLYTILRCRELLPRREDLHFNGRILRELADLSLLTCAQQSAMNFGILLVQRLVDSFGPVIMAAFAAAVKIDSFAYLPVQDFGNAFYFRRAELRCRTDGAAAAGLPHSHSGQRRFLLRHLGDGGAVCPAADADFRAGRRDGSAGGRRALPENRRCVLCRYRLPVPALRLLPGGAAPRHECCPDGDLSWDPRGAGLRAGGTGGRSWHLGGNSHWLVPCRFCGLRLLFSAAAASPFARAAGENGLNFEKFGKNKSADENFSKKAEPFFKFVRLFSCTADDGGAYKL